MAPSNSQLNRRRKKLRDDTAGTPLSRFGGGPDRTPAQNVAAWHDAVASGTNHIDFNYRDDDPVRYEFDGPLRAPGGSGLLVTGYGITPQRRATQIYARPGDYTLFDFTGSQGYTMDGVSVGYATGFHGTLIDASGYKTASGARREGKMFTYKNGWLGAFSKMTPPTAVGLRTTMGHGHRVENYIIGRCSVGVMGREAGEGGYSNRVYIRDGSFWENVTHIVAAGDGWTIENATMQQAYGDGKPDRVFRMGDGHSRPLQSVLWTGLWHGDSDRGVGWELDGVSSMVFQGRYGAAGPEPHTTIKCTGRVDVLDVSGAYFKGHHAIRHTAVDLGQGLVSDFRGGAYGVPGDEWYMENPVKGEPI